MSLGGAQFSRLFLGSDYPGFSIDFYEAGTTTGKNVWIDEGKATAVTQITADSRGMAKWYADGVYRMEVTDADGVLLYSWDNVTMTSDTGTLWEGNFGLSYPSAAASNRWQTFAKVNSSNKFLSLGINDGTAFIDIARAFNKGADIASAATLTPGRDGNYFDVTGTTGIIAIASLGVGSIIHLHFDDVLTLTHHSTNLVLHNDTNITTYAGMELTFHEYASGTYRLIGGLLIPHAHSDSSDGGALSGSAASGIRDKSRGLVIQNTSGTSVSQIDIDADEIILQDTSNAAFRVTSVNVTVDISVVGANALDTGSEANSTWYYIWVISDGTTTAGLLSASSTAPTLPTGYTYQGLIGAIYNDSAGNFIQIYQQGNEVEYLTTQTIQDGSFTATNWTAIDVTTYFPTTAKRCKFVVGDTMAMGLSPRSDGQSGAYFRSYVDSSIGTSDFGGVLATARGNVTTLEIRYADSIYYYVHTAASTLMALGWSYD